MKLAIVTSIQAPYQVELFNALAVHFELSVIFMEEIARHRPWGAIPLTSPSIVLAQGGGADATAASWMADADLAIFNWYQDARALKWMQAREDARRPWVFWGERPGFTLPQPLGSWYRKYKLQVLHRSHAPIWGIGSWAVERYREEFGAARDYVNIPYFSELNRFQRAAKLQKSPVARTFLYSGKLNERKGVDLILDAAKTLLPRQTEARFVLAGDGPLRPQAEAFAAKFPDRVEVLGFVPWERLPEVYARADVLLAPSRYDGWNLAVPEGLAAGLPVISTNQTGAALDLIRHGDNGWIVRAGSSGELTDAIGRAMSCPLPIFTAAAASSVKNHGLEHGAEIFARATAVAFSAWQ